MWRSWLARAVWDREVEGSSPFTPTIQEMILIVPIGAILFYNLEFFSKIEIIMFDKVKNLFKKDKTKKLEAVDFVVAFAGVLTFAALSLGNISRWSIWFDEAFSAYLIRFNYFDVARYTSTDVHPPLYYWILKFWSQVFGNSELALRSLSLVFILTAIIFVWYFIRKYFGRGASVVSMSLMAIAPLMMRYSEEARMYGMAMFIVVAATFTLFSIVKKPTKRKYIIYGVLISLGMWTHYFTAIMWLSHWAWRFWYVHRHKQSFWTKPWILTHIAAVASFVPWMPFMVKQLSGVQGGGFWIQPINFSTPFSFIGTIFMYRDSSESTGYFAILGIISLIIGISLAVKSFGKLKGDKKDLFSLICFMALMPMVILMILSLPPLRPSFVDRYLVPALPFWSALVGVSVATFWREKTKFRFNAAKILFVTCMIMSISGVFYLYQIGNYNKHANDNLMIRPLMQEIFKRANPGEKIVANSSWRFYETHYYQTEINPVYFEATDDIDWGSYDMLRYNDYRKIYDTPKFAADNGGEIWYVGDWKYGEVEFPKEGNWKIIQEVKAPGSNDSEKMIRAVKLRLTSAE